MNIFRNYANEIDIEREEVKKKVDQHFLKFFGEVDKLEAECKEKAELEKDSQSEINLEDFDNKFSNLKEQLDRLKIDTDHWKVKVKSDEHIFGLKGFIRDRQNEPLLNNSHKFVSDLRNDILKEMSEVKIVTEKVRFYLRNLIIFIHFLIDFLFM